MRLNHNYLEEREEVMKKNGNHYPSVILAQVDSKPAFCRFRDRLLPYIKNVNEAHLVMLSEQGIVKQSDAGKIMRAIEKIDYSVYPGMEYSGEFEDLYFQMEKQIIDMSGGAGGNLHLGRSRNDMSMTWSRLGVRKHLISLIEKLIHFQNTVRLFAETHKSTVYVIHTHTQHAQPGLLGHYFLGFTDVIDRCIGRFCFAYDATNQSPMGAAAATTTGFPISRDRVCELLGFDKTIECSYDAIGNFDHFFTSASAISLCALDLGRTITDLLLWSTEEEKMIILADGYSSTSSIMPQKRNPIALEHLRGSLSLIKGLADTVHTAFLKCPYGDVSDHEDVEDTLDAAFTKLEESIELFNAVLATTEVNKELLEKRAYESFSTVTELADEMVRACGVPFRKAHGFVSHMVKKAEQQNFNLKNITEDFFTEAYEEYFDSSFDMAFAPFHNCLDPLRFIYVRDIPGGTGPTAMENLLRSALQKVQTNETWLEQKKTGIRIADKKLSNEIEKIVKY